MRLGPCSCAAVAEVEASVLLGIHDRLAGARPERLAARVALDERRSLVANLLCKLEPFGDRRGERAEGQDNLERLGVFDGLPAALPLVCKRRGSR